MSEDNNQLPGDDEAQRLLEELEREGKEPESKEPESKEPESKEPESKEPESKEPAKPKAAKKKAAQESEDEKIVNKTPRVFNILHVSLRPSGMEGDSYTPNEQDAQNERFVRKVARAVELGVLAIE